MTASLEFDKPRAEGDKLEVEETRTGLAEHEHRARLTRRILLKTDTRVLPILALLFLCSFLDRTNVGNAKILGLAEDLGITDLQYNQGLAVFYATYIARYDNLSRVPIPPPPRGRTKHPVKSGE